MPKYIVRYGAMRLLGILSTRGGAVFDREAKVIARTGRGLEAGVVLCEATENATRQLEKPGSGQILREMSSGDATCRTRPRVMTATLSATVSASP